MTKRGCILEMQFRDQTDSQFFFKLWIEIDFFYFSLNFKSRNHFIFSTKIHKISTVESQNQINLQILLNLKKSWFENRLLL